ncbi:MFS transporter [Streptomyces albipurpureus]|uniref:MFS transporter n=1 Tax=Streptomyces albipurpureus TaxID=2897419 RepID=A0ABT0UTJ6_9ACTN|nr:MFS transporter [Streptomyces sp. CWNU-1]MCM2391785.1 MFS transporter [Streptomyces sp. CWNU-1]
MEIPLRLRQARSALLLIFLVHGAVFALLVTRIPAIQDRYGLSDAALPAFLAAVPILAGVGSLSASRLVRRVPAPTVVRILQPVICLTLVGVGTGRSVWHLALSLAVFGLMVGALEATMNMTGVGIQSGYGRSIMLRFHGAASLGGIIGASLAWAGAHWDFSLSVLYTVAVAVLLPVGVAAGPRLAGVPTKTDVPAAAGAATPGRRAGVPWKPLLPLCLIMAVAVVADSTATNWSAKFLQDTLGSSEALATVPYNLYMVATLVGRGFGDQWVRRWGAATVIRAGALLSAVGFSVIAAAPGPWVGVFGFAILGGGLSVIIPQVFTVGAQLLPGSSDTAIARINLFNYVGFLVGPPLIGAMGAAVSYRAAMCVPLVLVLGVLLIARSLVPPARPEPSTPLPQPTATTSG